MIIIGTPEQIGAILCGEQQHDEHCRGWRWHLYVADTKARMRAVDDVARRIIAQTNINRDFRRAVARSLQQAAE